MRKFLSVFVSLLGICPIGEVKAETNTELLEAYLSDEEEEFEIRDPLENINRPIMAFNMVLDRMILMPLSLGYKHLVPDVLKNGIENFIFNSFSPVRIINFTLQGNIDQVAKTMFRFIFNFVFGFFGLFDPAKALGVEPKDTNFGQTLAKWGGKPGPYIVLPVFGPTSARGMMGKVVTIPLDTAVQLSFLKFRKKTRKRIYYTLFGLDLIASRSKIIDIMDKMMDLYDDEYVLIRSVVMGREYENEDDYNGE